jgi:predicted HTH transcriptional regulator
MDYVDMSHLVSDERYRDRLTYDGRWENNLYQFFTIVLPKITFDLPRSFKMIGMQRVDDTPQYQAVREALTNALIHSDILMDAGVLRIDKYDDRLCFRNPGVLKLPISQIYEGGASKARNPRIQNMLRMIGFGENLGSGFPKNSCCME